MQECCAGLLVPSCEKKVLGDIEGYHDYQDQGLHT